MTRPLKLLFYFFSTVECGYGHHYRSLALAQAAKDRGHTVGIASNRKPPSQFQWLKTDYLNQPQLFAALDSIQPDWLIVDLPHTPPAWIREMYGGKIAFLNGIGYDQAENSIDLRVIQGVADLELPKGISKDNTLMGLEYVIIRPEIERYRGIPRGEFTLCWGGGNDHLSLMPRYARLYPDEPVWFAVADMTPIPHNLTRHHWVVDGGKDGADLFNFQAMAKKAVVAMGMITWELAYLGTEINCFSYSDLHLMFAQGMARAGLIKAYPKVGLPETDEEFRAFITEPFEVTGERPDTNGARRIIKSIEERS